MNAEAPEAIIPESFFQSVAAHAGARTASGSVVVDDVEKRVKAGLADRIVLALAALGHSEQ
jgi:hypothetical protein